MNDDAVLDHLLRIEAEADSLVDEAQAEADRRIKEGERQSRAAYESLYRNGAELEDAEFQKEIDKVRENCQKELTDYREKIAAIKADNDRFSAVLESLLAGEA
jgi:regulator of protease activity HflC (stomatin/prohibitin superfamily)